MKLTGYEYSVFRGVVKAIGVYQLIVGASDICGVLFEKAGIKYAVTGGPLHQSEYVAWTIFHLCVALLLLYGTDFVCRIAYSYQELENLKNEPPNPGKSSNPS